MGMFPFWFGLQGQGERYTINHIRRGIELPPPGHGSIFHPPPKVHRNLPLSPPPPLFFPLLFPSSAPWRRLNVIGLLTQLAGTLTDPGQLLLVQQLAAQPMPPAVSPHLGPLGGRDAPPTHPPKPI